MEIEMMNYKKLSQLNKECFGSKDEMNSIEKLQEWNTEQHHGIITEQDKAGNFLGYVLWYITNDGYITIYRRGVAKSARGLGLGIKLTRRVIAEGINQGLHFWTYAHKTNLSSINSSIKCGCEIYKISQHWCELVKKIK